jgi:hypothetical protein
MNLGAPMEGARPLWFWAVITVVALLLMAVVLSTLSPRANEIITIAADTATFLGIIALVMGVYQYIRVQQPEARLREALEKFGEEENDLKRWFAKHDIVNMGRFAIPRLGELVEPAQTRSHALEALIAIIDDEELATSEQLRAVEVLRTHAHQANTKSAVALLRTEEQSDAELSACSLRALIDLLRINPPICRDLIEAELPERQKQILAFALARTATPSATNCLVTLARNGGQPLEVSRLAARLLGDEKLRDMVPPEVTIPAVKADETVERTLTQLQARLEAGRGAREC